MSKGPKLPRYLDIYNIYLFEIRQDVTIRSCIPCLEYQLQKKSNYSTIKFGRYFSLKYPLG